jgi:hypothetical protein
MVFFIQAIPVTGEKQVHRPLDIEHVKRQNKNAPTIIGTSPKILNIHNNITEHNQKQITTKIIY